MKVLLVGGGGREHALAWKIAQSPLVDVFHAAPGNPGIARHARTVDLKVADADALVNFAARERIDLTVVGPEAPLVAGLADRFRERGLAVFGPSAEAAAIEGSKVFAKTLMARHGIPTARFQSFTDADRARRYCRELGAPLVVKADGLAAGKGVIVCRSVAESDVAVAECMERHAFGAAGASVVIEEFMVGQEASFFAIVSGTDVVPLGGARDHKTVFDGDRGPNTGGMGAYSPVPELDSAMTERIVSAIVRPTVKALSGEGRPYHGFLYAGLMLSADGPKVVEFNCRFGDPECQAIMPRIDGDLVPMLAAVARGEAVEPATLDERREAAVCVMLASGGYPGTYRTGFPIKGIDAAEKQPGITVFHSGTALRDGEIVTAGGRVLGVTAVGDDVDVAVARAYAAIDLIRFEGVHYRTDIGRGTRSAAEHASRVRRPAAEGSARG